MLVAAGEMPLESHLHAQGVRMDDAILITAQLSRSGFTSLTSLALLDDDKLAQAGVGEARHRAALLSVKNMVATQSREQRHDEAVPSWPAKQEAKELARKQNKGRRFSSQFYGLVVARAAGRLTRRGARKGFLEQDVSVTMRFVCINANRGRSMHWQVQFKVEGRVQHFGMFVDEEVAGKVAAFAKAKLNMGAGVNSIKCVFLFKSFVCVARNS